MDSTHATSKAASTTEEIAASTTRNVEADGVVFTIRRIPLLAAEEILGRNPGTAFADQLAYMRAVAAGNVKGVHFEGEGSPNWDDLSLAQQIVLHREIIAFTTQGLEEASAFAATFRNGKQAGGAAVPGSEPAGQDREAVGSSTA